MKGKEKESKENGNSIFCMFYSLIKGPLGKTIAILGVCMIGVMFYFGRMSLGLLVVVVILAAMAFASLKILALLAGCSDDKKRK